jgi:cell wall-associated NlpC family hydrolase
MRTREEAVQGARAWKGTPYVMRGRLRGAGCDCATFLAEYLIEIGAVADVDVPLYAGDWFHHSTDERYLRSIVKYAVQTAEGVCAGTLAALPGNLILFRSVGSKFFNHGAVIVQWPRILHSVLGGVAEANAVQHPLTAFRSYAIFDPWIKPL